MEEANAEVDYTNLSHVMAAITNERASQVSAWSAAHDYGHSMIEWAGIVAKYTGRAVDAPTPEVAQENWIKAAAVCVAAVQAMALWQYGPNPAYALAALHAKIQAQSEQPASGEE